MSTKTIGNLSLKNMLVLQKAKDLPLPIIPSHQGRGNMTLFSGIEMQEPGESKPNAIALECCQPIGMFCISTFLLTLGLR